MRTKKSTFYEKASLANETIKAVLFATIFTFLSDLGGIKAILEEQLKIYLFPFAAVTEIITTLLALARFVTAKNRNLGKTFDLGLSLAMTSLVLTAVIGGLWFGLAPVLVGSLFLAAIGMGVLYNLGQLVYHTYRGLSAPSLPENKAFKAMYYKQSIKYGIASLIGIAVLTGIVFTLMLPVMTPLVVVLTTSGVAGIVAALACGLGLIYRIGSSLDPSIPNRTSTQDSSFHDEPARLVNRKGFDYYNLQPHAKPNGEHTEEALLAWISRKKTSLENQIEESNGRFSERIWSQKTKRENKIDYLIQVEKVVKNPTTRSTIRLANCGKSGTFQSFFKHEGEIKLIDNEVLGFLNSRLESQDTLQR